MVLLSLLRSRRGQVEWLWIIITIIVVMLLIALALVLYTKSNILTGEILSTISGD